MLMSRRRSRHIGFGLYQFDSPKNGSLSGFGEGDFIRLRDEHGNEWRGAAEVQWDDSVRFRFRDTAGRWATGVGDSGGITLRDDRGNTWRGFVQ